MIRLFNKNETNFDHNETILQPIKCRVKEVANGNFELSYESLQDKNIENGKIISAPTPRGNQLFRIYNTKHKLRKTSAKARAIFYDLNANIIEDSRAVSTSGSGALNTILGGTTFPHKFEGQSTVTNIATSYFVRKNPVQAMLGDGGLIARWGGYLYRDNYTIKHIPYGRDLGYDIRYGKNLKGIDVETDDSEVITRALPTWVVDNVVKMLPEKYIDSPLVNAYPFPLVGELRVNVPESERDPQAYVRKEVEAAFKNGLDKPKVNYQFDFVVLRDLPEYRDFMWVEELDLYDTVTVQVPKMDVMVTAALMSYEYDAIKERFISAEIGDARNSMTKSISNSIAKVEQKIDVKASELLQKQKEATDKLSGVTGGNIVINRTPDGEPYEILVMDTDDISTARNVVGINQQGIGFSSNGVIGPYGVAITIDGHIVADYIDVGTLAAEIIKTGVLADASGKNYLNMESGAFNLGDKITYDPTTGQFRIDAALLVDEISGTNLKLAGKNITLDGDTTVLGTFSVPGSSLFGTIDAQTIRIKNQDLSEFVRGFLDTPTFSTGFNTTQPATMKGNSIAYGANSSYIQMRDTGGRGQIIVNGTIAVSGSTYFYEMNADGFAGGPSMSGAATLLRSTGTTTQINDGNGGRGFNVGPSISVVKQLSVNEGISIANGMKLDGYDVTRGTDGTLKWS